MMSIPTAHKPNVLATPETEFDRFVYTVSHDLQEPLRLVGSFVKLLNTKCGDEISEDGKQYLSYITENTEKMKKMIYALVDYSRVDRNQEAKVLIDLEEVIENIKGMYSPEIDICKASIEYGNLPQINAQPSLVIELLKQLFKNSFEAFDGKPLNICLSCEDDGDMWKFCLADNGMGISCKPLDRIFEIFCKVDRPDENLGAGLAISKAIVNKHGGKMFVESSINQGTKMYFTFPK